MPIFIQHTYHIYHLYYQEHQFCASRKEIILANSYPNSHAIDTRSVETVVRQIFPLHPVQITRVAEGVSTIVYRIISSNEIFFLRILPEEQKHESFAPEVTIHTQLRRLQVKVPEVIYFEDYNELLQQSIMVTTEIKGLPLSRSSSLNKEKMHAILIEAGRDLAHVNNIPVQGFGWVKRDQSKAKHLQAQWSTHRAFALEYWDADLAFLAQNILTRSDIAQIEQVRSRYNTWLDVEQGQLAHGDFDTTHIYQEKGHYTGIIDFGEIRGTNACYDLGHFHMREEDVFPERLLPFLLQGYQDIKALLPEHEHFIRFAACLITIRTLARILQKRPHTPYQLRGLRQDLAFLLDKIE